MADISDRMDLERLRWLTSPAATLYLDWAMAFSGELPQLMKRLRQQLTSAQTHEVVTQVQLRRRAAQKFSQAHRLFFTDVGLQQATSEAVARYKAATVPYTGHLADLCCGIGGDLLQLAAKQPATGFDRDPRCAHFATANCQPLGCTLANVRCEDVRQVDLSRFTAWHIDPDRRASGKRTVRVELAEPSLEFLEGALSVNPHGAIKLAPATTPPAAWQRNSEWEWIGEGAECKQLLVRSGGWARYPGQRTASLVDPAGQLMGQVSGHLCEVGTASTADQYVFEPHACVRAARLVGALAQQEGLLSLNSQTHYLTGSHPSCHGLLRTFRVLEVVPAQLRHLQSTVGRLGWGHVEIKQREGAVSPEQLQRRLRGAGAGAGVIIITQIGGRRQALLAERMVVRTTPPK